MNNVVNKKQWVSPAFLEENVGSTSMKWPDLMEHTIPGSTFHPTSEAFGPIS